MSVESDCRLKYFLCGENHKEHLVVTWLTGLRQQNNQIKLAAVNVNDWTINDNYRDLPSDDNENCYDADLCSNLDCKQN